LGNELTNSNIGPLLGYDAVLVPVRIVTPESDSGNAENGGLNTNTTKILIGVFVSIAVVVLITVTMIIYFKRKGVNKVVDEIVPQISEDPVDNSVKK
jgi:hypothetical protein